MSEHCGYVVKVEQLRPHSNADRMQIATFFGNDTCVDLSVKVGDIGIYFPTDLQLSEEFCAANNLVRRKDENGNNIGGYMDPIKRNVTTIRLRGEKSDGLYLPISCLSYLCVDKSIFHPSTTISVINGHEICCKWIPMTQAPRGPRKEGNRTRKKHPPIAPLFQEHADTEQLAYNMDAFKPGDQIEITLKMHGTSQRTGYLPTFKGYKRTFWDWLRRRAGKPIYDWGYVTGTRRTVLNSYDGGYYGSNQFREQHAKFFEGKLHKGETVYYEVVGFTTDGAPIMSPGDNKKTNDKAFIKQYGPKTVFSYGCAAKPEPAILHAPDMEVVSPAVPQSAAYVYRMTMTNEDGDVVEYTPDYMRYRCEQMGAKTVPVFCQMYLGEDYGRVLLPQAGMSESYMDGSLGDIVRKVAEQFYDGPDPIGKTHVREGVVIRIVNRPKFTAYKHKNFSFKVLEGIAKADAEAPDMEEAEEVLEDTDNA